MLHLPAFPETKKLEISDKSIIEDFVAGFRPYSDYNFTSLYAWDIFGTTEICNLFDNLVVKFNDYITNKAFYSFLGSNKVNTTAEILLAKAQEEGLETTLQLIPETVAKELDSDKLVVLEDRDQFDYIVSIESQTSLSGEKNHPKKRRIKKLLASGMDIQDVALGKLSGHSLTDEIAEVFDTWAKVKVERGLDIRETHNESRALHRLLAAKELDAELFTITLDGKMAAFFIGEPLGSDYFIGHFEKADPNIEGLFQYIKHSVALNLHARGIKYMNIEQDLGVEGLRHAKMGSHPVHFLKKYTVSLAN
ncbi:MAG TPA: phosphatidylglycerol lysyltransferase domain-containing protein [Candidatus Saccharimonadales bacterium]|nr:phosphatidylglycerol lysyltransferase domain-containing protein [Candidatus Saccharimonadales bacterium]